MSSWSLARAIILSKPSASSTRVTYSASFELGPTPDASSRMVNSRDSITSRLSAIFVPEGGRQSVVGWLDQAQASKNKNYFPILCCSTSARMLYVIPVNTSELGCDGTDGVETPRRRPAGAATATAKRKRPKELMRRRISGRTATDGRTESRAPTNGRCPPPHSFLSLALVKRNIVYT